MYSFIQDLLLIVVMTVEESRQIAVFYLRGFFYLHNPICVICRDDAFAVILSLRWWSL